MLSDTHLAETLQMDMTEFGVSDSHFLICEVFGVSFKGLKTFLIVVNASLSFHP